MTRLEVSNGKITFYAEGAKYNIERNICTPPITEEHRQKLVELIRHDYANNLEYEFDSRKHDQ